jgi:drug/metabolite transporter (DMT)-like permease
MIWLIVGLIPPILWALVNHTDKFLLSKSEYKSSVGVLMVYSIGFSLVVLPVLTFFTWQDLFLSWEQVITQVVGGVLLTLSIYLYLLALNKEEASVVIPLSLLVPVFGFILSYFVLGEVLTSKQIIACLLIVGGSLIISLEFGEERGLRIKHRVLGLMVLMCFAQAVQEILFKYVSIENSFVVSFFWLHVGILLFGSVLAFFKRNLLSDFTRSVRQNGLLLFAVNFISEAVSVFAFMVRDYAILFVPITVIMTLNGYQPVFVFLLGIILTLFAPRFVKEKIRPTHLVHKGAAIAVICIGTVLIAQSLS